MPQNHAKNIYIAIYFVPIFIPHQLSVRHNLRVSCNCAACFFKREIQVALFTFTHLHRHLISSPLPIHLFTFNNSPFFTFTNSSLYLHQFTIFLPSTIYHLFNHFISSTTRSRSRSSMLYYCVGQISLCVEFN